MGYFQPEPFGRYILAEKLSMGGMGEVFRAKTFGIDGFEKQMAIKRILPQYSNDPQFIRMLVDEAKLSVLLTHTNIVQVFDLGKIGENYFIAMELIHGVDLRRILTHLNVKGQTLPEEFAVYIISEVCRGLDYAHFKQDSEGQPLHIIHRDISPPNILISFEGEVKIVDFGVAKAAMNISHTLTGMLKGKITYMSPEQATGKPMDHRSDIFSTGMVLHEILTGERLLVGETALEILDRLRTLSLNESSFSPTLPNPLRKILAKALANSAEDRYQTAGALQVDLIHYLYSVHPDFTPLKFAEWMRQLFGGEIKRKADLRREEAPLDAKTITDLKNRTEQENIVHREEGITLRERIQGSRSRPWSLLRSLAYPLAAVLLLGTGLGLWAYWPRSPISSNPPPVEKRIQTSPAAPEETPATAALNISSNPPGAKIFIEGVDTGKTTPAVFTQFKVGEIYNIRLVRTGYHELIRPVQLPEPKAFFVDETLTPIKTAQKSSSVSSPRLAEKASSEKSSTASEKEKKDTEAPMKKGFKKAGSSIRHFFGGGDDK